jgi:hypothetical protein
MTTRKRGQQKDRAHRMDGTVLTAPALGKRKQERRLANLIAKMSRRANRGK